ncbi:pentapeptide repeat-containing protein [Glutamicibacter sp. JL.03c]|uniref:pentapeptide repeat-containing protein n=1 Tax=Glutamicibacter sp. JL.03c TaxID=2984842 RepID=UPI0021F7890F|nr:pentapeptide repeat-containing protein [Glutamicibacter sp. JL.03c]UYQ76136.1 pentapeptide repeat-containing protein [Glutamicibacter sp. JL.03c]
MNPKIRTFTLPELAAGYAGDLSGGEYVELLHFANIDEPVQAYDARVEECRFTSVALDNLRNARLLQCELAQINAPSLNAAGAFFNDVRVEHSRFGSADFAEAELDGVVFENCKFGWLNLRRAKARDVVFRHCQFEEIDFGGQIHRVNFIDSRSTVINCSGGQLRDVDLQGLDFAQAEGLENMRGAHINALQLSLLAGDMAKHLGIKVAQ